MAAPLNTYEEALYCLPNQISLQAASGGPGLLKKAGHLLQQGMQSLVTTDRWEEYLQYGCNTGSPRFRQVLANFLTRQYGQPVDKDDLVVAYGASLSVELLMEMFHPEQTIFIEDPTYYVMSKFAPMKNNAVAIPLERDGMDLDELEKKLKELPDDATMLTPPYKALVYVIVAHHNPSGISYSVEKCQRLVELARKHNLLIVSDDVYVTLAFDAEPKNGNFPAQRLFAYDRKEDVDYKGNVVSVGSFSKNLAPGLRLAWIEAPTAIRDAFIDNYAVVGGGGMCPFVGGVVAELMKCGSLDEHIHSLRRIHKERCYKFLEIIDAKVGKYGVKIRRPSGGCFMWLELPQDVTAESVLEVSRDAEKVTFMPGHCCSANSLHKNCMRLSFAFYELPEIIRGAEGLSRAIETVILKKS